MDVHVWWKGLVFMAWGSTGNYIFHFVPTQVFLNKLISSSYCILLILKLCDCTKKKSVQPYFEVYLQQ